MCQEIVSEQGGSIALLERAGPGATFRVELPERAPRGPLIPSARGP